METIHKNCGLTFKVGEITEGSLMKGWVPLIFTCNQCRIEIRQSVNLGINGYFGSPETMRLLLDELSKNPTTEAFHNLRKARTHIVIKNCRLLKNLR